MANLGHEKLDSLVEKAMRSSVGRKALEYDPTRRALSLVNIARRRAEQAARGLAPRHRSAARAVVSPTVGVALYVQNAANLLPAPLSEELLAAVDEVVVLDGGSSDGTPDVARELGARVVDAPWPGSFAIQMERAIRACRADWVLNLDADELASEGLIGALPELIRTRRHVGWWLSRQWVVESSGLWTIASLPYWPDYQARLVRNSPDVRYEGLHHKVPSYRMPGTWGFAKNAPIVHLDLLINSRSAREQKVRERLQDPDFIGGERFNLWEDHPVTLRPMASGAAAVRAALQRVSTPAG